MSSTRSLFEILSIGHGHHGLVVEIGKAIKVPIYLLTKTLRWTFWDNFIEIFTNLRQTTDKKVPANLKRRWKWNLSVLHQHYLCGIPIGIEKTFLKNHAELPASDKDEKRLRIYLFFHHVHYLTNCWLLKIESYQFHFFSAPQKYMQPCSCISAVRCIVWIDIGTFTLPQVKIETDPFFSFSV